MTSHEQRKIKLFDIREFVKKKKEEKRNELFGGSGEANPFGGGMTPNPFGGNANPFGRSPLHLHQIQILYQPLVLLLTRHQRLHHLIQPHHLIIVVMT